MNEVSEHMMRVECIQEREFVSGEKTIVGGIYYVDKDSIILDVDGDAYGDVYADEEKRHYLGRKLLKRFRTR